MKTIEEYMNDPDLAGEPEALREVHAIRLMQQDETKDMTPEQRREYTHKKATAFLAGPINRQGRNRDLTLLSFRPYSKSPPGAL
jgi:hypothetical protein